MSDASELLVEVKAAITAILKAQEFRLGDKWLTRADLGETRKLRDELLREVAEENRAGSGILVQPIIFKHGG